MRTWALVVASACVVLVAGCAGVAATVSPSAARAAFECNAVKALQAGDANATQLEAALRSGDHHEIVVAANAVLLDVLPSASARSTDPNPADTLDPLVGAALWDLAQAAGNLEALDRSVRVLDDLGMRFETARSLLARGIVHRRRREKRLADADLRRALGTFRELGATAWAERAGEELGRVGLRPRAPGHLTETERTVARLAAAGRTNREIAALAFMSPRTVEGVLARAYSKLGVGSRAELGREMARLEAGGAPGGD
jgi:DNA-binding CsgD family transcriptional regulator